MQETLLAAQARHRFFGRSSERTWLVAILRHKILDSRRRDARIGGPAPTPASAPAPRVFDDQGHWIEAPSAWKTPPEALDAGELWTAVDGCLGRIPGHLAEAFRLREIEGVGVESLRETLALERGEPQGPTSPRPTPAPRLPSTPIVWPGHRPGPVLESRRTMNWPTRLTRILTLECRSATELSSMEIDEPSNT